MIKHSEVDNYNEGCDPSTSQSVGINIKLSGNSKGEIIEEIKNFLGLTTEEFNDYSDFNACGEVGRIDVQILEDNNGVQASEHEIEEWKKGYKKLWLVDYSMYVEIVERKAFDLEG